jgi:hypothetical protein
LDWEFDVDILDDDCVEDDILSVGTNGSRIFDRLLLKFVLFPDLDGGRRKRGVLDG